MVAVAVAMSTGGGDFEQSCLRCGDPDLRQRWGCDTPTEEPQFWMGPCVWCAGHDEHCTHCAGHNRIPFHRCPHKLATREFIDVVQSVALVEQGVLPDEGGWFDQATTFVQAFNMVSNEIQRTRARLAEQAQQRARKQRQGR